VANIKYDLWLPRVTHNLMPFPFGVSLLVFLVIAWVLIRTPLMNAGSPDEPAPPSAMV